jgi:hypothetical protein
MNFLQSEGVIVMDKQYILNIAVEITKEYARGGDVKRDVNLVLKDVYHTLKELQKDADSQ